MDVGQETKKLVQELRENEAGYISGELDLNKTIDQTEALYNVAVKSNNVTASTILLDSDLLDIQTRITKKKVEAYKIDTLEFDPRQFAIKVRNKYLGSDTPEDARRRKPFLKLWEKLGEFSKDKFHAVPNFSFIYGTFEPSPVEAIKKTRKRTVKDKIGVLTKPELVKSTKSKEDGTLIEANRVLKSFYDHSNITAHKSLCYYEFVTDPESFTRTVENIFHVSLLLKEGILCLYSDKDGMPFLREVKKGVAGDGGVRDNQCIISLDMNDWEEIVESFQIKKALIPKRVEDSSTT